MGGAVLIAVLAITGARAGCAPLEVAIDAAEEALLLLDLPGVQRELETAETLFTCGWLPDPSLLARFWLLEGSLASMEGDDEGTTDAFQAARRVAPDTWIEGLGDPLRRRFDAAHTQPSARGHLITKGVEEGYLIQINGVPVAPPLDVPAGLQLVQIGREQVRFAQMIYVLPNTVTTLAPKLPLLPPSLPVRDPNAAPRPTIPQPLHEDTLSLDLFTGVGISAAVGEASIRETSPGLTVHEPALKLRIPVEAGLVLRASSLWIRGAASVAPLVGGEIRYLDQEKIQALPWTLSTEGALGGSVGPVDLGASGGLLWPDRVSARLIGSAGPPSLPLRLEARLGVDLHLDGGLEPAAGLLTTFTPELIH
ncbi:MAG TPA: hypothetical protein ENK18_25165 [Deltaproteobacteria bacterium]|nr:hypothetical protein [Deltaproteobacteria bacterium]